HAAEIPPTTPAITSPAASAAEPMTSHVLSMSSTTQLISAAASPPMTSSPAYTSQTCPQCGHCEKANRPTRNNFICVKCGFAAPADRVGALTLLGCTPTSDSLDFEQEAGAVPHEEA